MTWGWNSIINFHLYRFTRRNCYRMCLVWRSWENCRHTANDIIFFNDICHPRFLHISLIYCQTRTIFFILIRMIWISTVVENIKIKPATARYNCVCLDCFKSHLSHSNLNIFPYFQPVFILFYIFFWGKWYKIK